MEILLVEPDFPYPNKSKHSANGVHKNFVPIGLLKLGAMHKDKGNKVDLVRGCLEEEEVDNYNPDQIYITSLFTYWSEYVWEAVECYRNYFKDSEIIIGGLYVTLCNEMDDFKEKIKQYEVNFHTGLHLEAEDYLPDYNLIGETGYHLTHTTRGCIRDCDFCGVSDLEPKRTIKNPKEVIEEIKEIGKRKVIFFDNNFLTHPKIEDLLKKLSDLKIDGRKVKFESQSGFDGRLIEKNPKLAKLLKKASFKNIRFAWDWGYDLYEDIKKQLDILIEAGYRPEDIFIFMIYNWKFDFKEMEKKRLKCWDWGVQISDCRFRPLDQLYDNYNPHKRKQTSKDYFIHKKWNDSKIRQFRRNVRRHNICVRYNFPFYSRKLENMKINKEEYKEIYKLPKEKVKQKLDDVWFPDEFTDVEDIYK